MVAHFTEMLQEPEAAICFSALSWHELHLTPVSACLSLGQILILSIQEQPRKTIAKWESDE